MSDDEHALAPEEMARLTTEIRAMTRRLSRDQVLDLADLLHEVVRERQFQERSWRRRISPQAAPPAARQA